MVEAQARNRSPRLEPWRRLKASDSHVITSPRMLSLPNLADMWHVLKAADLNKVRREAERPFQVLLVAEDVGDAEGLGRLLSSPATTRHPWLLPADPADAQQAAGSRALDLAVVLSPIPDPSLTLAAVADTLRNAKVPVVMVVFGSPNSTVAVAWPGEAARAAVIALEPSAMPAVAQALLAAVSPGMRLALARQLVPLREPLFAELIEETAKTNAMYALTTSLAEVVPVLDVPLNLADIVVLTKNQLVMSYRIALASGKKGTPRELLASICTRRKARSACSPRRASRPLPRTPEILSAYAYGLSLNPSPRSKDHAGDVDRDCQSRACLGC
jgi:hypothetical protein